MLNGVKAKLRNKFSKERINHFAWRLRHLKSRRRAARLIIDSALLDIPYIERYYGLTNVTLSFFLSYGTEQRLNPNPLFDIDYYVELYPELESISSTYLQHFIEYANRDGLNPHPLFDTKFYLNTNPDVTASGMNALSHFIKYGAKEGRNPHPLFDINYYLSSNPDVQRSGVNALSHFVEYGWRELRNPHPLFDCRYYLYNNPDVVAVKANPLVHFLTFGAREDRNPHPWFNVRHYKTSIGEENVKDTNPLIHYLSLGPNVIADPHPDFSSRYYSTEYQCTISPLLDYVTNGYAEARITSPRRRVVSLKDNRDSFGEGLTTLKSETQLPRISVLVPVYNTPLSFLKRAIGSVLRQTYENWELCICDDCSSDPAIADFLEEIADIDKRIKVITHRERGHISRATNSAFDISTGDYIALLDHDDELTHDALQTIAGIIISNPGAKLIYSDEDYINESNRCFSPHYKLGWNYDLFLGQNYLCHLTTIARECMEAVGGLRATFEGAQDWDLFLRISEIIEPSQIVHIPRVLYHWRVHQASTASGMDAKPYAANAQIRAVESHLQRVGAAATVQVLPWANHLRVRYLLPKPTPSVGVFVVVPKSARRADVDTCIEAVKQSDFPGVDPFVILPTDGTQSSDFSQLRLLNDSLLASDKDVFIVLGSLGIPINVDWVDELISRLSQPNVGVVGGKIISAEDNRFLEAGLETNIHGHHYSVFEDLPRDSNGPYGRAALARTTEAVGISCFATLRSVFLRAGGLNVSGFKSVNNDVSIDYCKRLSEQGQRAVFTPFVEYQVSRTRCYCERLLIINGGQRNKPTWPEMFGRIISSRHP